MGPKMAGNGGKQIILHVGLHKTATTFLQERVFPALPGVRFVHPVHYPRPDDGPIERFVLDLLYRNAACIDIDRHRTQIDAWLAEVAEPIVLISSEALVGIPAENHRNILTNAELLAELFPAAKICLVFRRQDRWAESAFSQLLKQGFSTTIERYLNYRDGEFGPYNVGLFNGPNVDARDLDWERFDALYRRRFGADSVCALPFELFVTDSHEFLRRLYAFAEIEPGVFPDTRERVNERWSALAVGLAQVVNVIPMRVKRTIRDYVSHDWHPSAVLSRTVIPRLPGWIPGVGKADSIGPKLSAALLELHRDDNRRLGERIGIDLSQYGY
jgi:hypothetical protein